ncbi:hypothetical protein DPEC_G00152210 [Dallia pectoralis]|uniref:Uncharacterized protein n=1 Tax=Dallia pectoralis TaxID=75939 RepID=A0ACC2GJH6_DALPE|nr:hypothetical protein DPEC_G00152210 [Dallia pectoralis]
MALPSPCQLALPRGENNEMLCAQRPAEDPGIVRLARTCQPHRVARLLTEAWPVILLQWAVGLRRYPTEPGEKTHRASRNKEVLDVTMVQIQTGIGS